jgi:hypothetical protein
MFVPSLSWQVDRFSYTNGCKKGVLRTLSFLVGLELFALFEDHRVYPFAAARRALDRFLTC